MNKNSKIYVPGHTGLLGTALVKKLKERYYTNIITMSHKDLDLTDKNAVDDFFREIEPEHVFLAAGKTGGILANKTYPADFLHVNIAIQNNVFGAVQKYGVKYLVFYGSSCIYPKHSPQPLKEGYLFAGKTEETSEAYAIAKIAGIIACRSYNIQFNTKRFIALVPNTMFGPSDNFDLNGSHVLPALIRKFHDARQRKEKKVELWGSGNPRREFIFSEDVADASIFALEKAHKLENRHYSWNQPFLHLYRLAILTVHPVIFQGYLRRPGM